MKFPQSSSTARYMNLARKVRWHMQFGIIFLLHFYKHKILHSHDDPCLHSVLNTFSSICTKPSVLQHYSMCQCVHIMVGDLFFSPDSSYSPRQVDEVCYMESLMHKLQEDGNAASFEVIICF